MIITTSRKPSRRSRTLGRDLSNVLLGKYVTRGKAGLDVLVENARNLGEKRVVLIYDVHGNPGKVQFIRVQEDGWNWMDLIILLSGVTLQREIKHNGAKKRFKFSDLSLVNETDEDIKRYFDLDVTDESKNKMVVSSDRISFYVGSEEVGPKIRIKSWYHARRD